MACEAEVSGVVAKADQQRFAPAGGIVDVVILQVLHFFGLHFHHGGLGEHVPLFFGQVHHMHGSRGLTHLFADLGIRLSKGCERGESGLGHGDLAFPKG
ncbi:hypothetical protein MITS9509_02591 [Synechococcus sp. MIT S9509]|nr:hypothetical protein MITS9504_02308 [Synechococcus sp. MIT S9504]KZR91362.1 hypothetical protein MITS9509_02591 [Synechococcus sp. MIT S9509]